ncbi:MAG: hypothetical protein JSV81_03830 [Anaerolineales bacterium]|nr:MAG: hypothetical protein JSV81_03830 [Anaerolineales bacterium]
MTNGREFDKQGMYEIRIKGTLDRAWSDWFGGFNITPQGDSETLLIGPVADQSALHGLLSKIRDLGLPLLLVKRIDAEEAESNQSNRKSLSDTDRI